MCGHGRRGYAEKVQVGVVSRQDSFWSSSSVKEPRLARWESKGISWRVPFPLPPPIQPASFFLRSSVQLSEEQAPRCYSAQARNQFWTQLDDAVFTDLLFFLWEILGTARSLSPCLFCSARDLDVKEIQAQLKEIKEVCSWVRSENMFLSENKLNISFSR